MEIFHSSLEVFDLSLGTLALAGRGLHLHQGPLVDCRARVQSVVLSASALRLYDPVQHSLVHSLRHRHPLTATDVQEICSFGERRKLQVLSGSEFLGENHPVEYFLGMASIGQNERLSDSSELFLCLVSCTPPMITS